MVILTMLILTIFQRSTENVFNTFWYLLLFSLAVICSFHSKDLLHSLVSWFLNILCFLVANLKRQSFLLLLINLLCIGLQLIILHPAILMTLFIFSFFFILWRFKVFPCIVPYHLHISDNPILFSQFFCYLFLICYDKDFQNYVE